MRSLGRLILVVVASAIVTLASYVYADDYGNSRAAATVPVDGDNAQDIVERDDHAVGRDQRAERVPSTDNADRFRIARRSPHGVADRVDVVGEVVELVEQGRRAVRPQVVATAGGKALRQLALPGLTVVVIVSLAYLYNYSGMAYTLGAAMAGLLRDLS